MLEQNRKFGETRQTDTWLRSKDYASNESYQKEEIRLTEKYGDRLGVAIFDFAIMSFFYPPDDRPQILAEQVILNLNQGGLEEKAQALEGLLEAVLLNARRSRFG